MSDPHDPATPQMPVPDPALAPKRASDMAKEGEREGAVLKDAAAPQGDTDDDPQFAENGE